MRLIFIFGLFLFFIDVMAQTDFRSGYIITNDMDTIRGLVDYRGERRNMKVCNFKMDQGEIPRSYYASDIFGYRYDDGKYFISKEINTKNLNDTVFVEFLLNGISNLYYYSSSPYTAFFIESENGELMELRRELIEVEKDGHVYTKKDNKYLGLLNYAFKDCPEIRKDIVNTGLNHKDLIQLTKRYHDYVCTDESCIIYEKKLPVLKVQLRPFLAYSYSNISYNEIDFKASHSPVIGMGFNFIMPRWNEKLSLLVQFSVNKDYFYGTDINSSPFEYENGIYDLHYTNLLGSIMLKYTYPKGTVRPELFGGIYRNSILKDKSTFTSDNVSSTVVNTVVLEMDGIDKNQSGLILGGGLEYVLFKKVRVFSNVSVLFGSSPIALGNETSIRLSTGIIF